MFNYKFERILFVILWIALICLFSIVIPPQTNSFLIQYQYAASSLILTLLVFYIYRKISNHIIFKKIKNMVSQNNIELAINYVSKALENHPNFCWLKVKKLELLFLSGNICEYQTFRAVLYCRKRNLQKYVEILDYMIGFLRQDEINPSILIDHTNKEQSILIKIYYLLSNREKLPPDKLLILSSEIYNSSIPIYRCIASVVLSIYYMNIDDKINRTLYYEKAITYAPSTEVEHYLKTMFDK